MPVNIRVTFRVTWEIINAQSDTATRRTRQVGQSESLGRPSSRRVVLSVDEKHFRQRSPSVETVGREI
jgi:hypothetical protein